MADQVGQQDIAGLDIQKLVTGFEDEAIKLRKYARQSTTSGTQIRWYQKTAGFLDTTDSSGITASQIDNLPSRALPFVAGPSWTRNTSYVRKYMVESELISIEDIKTADVDVLATSVRDLVLAVERRVEARIYAVLTENDTPSTIQTISITNEWDDTTNGVPVSDLLKAREYIENYNYNADNLVLFLRPDACRFLLDYIISVKGNMIPNFSSEKARSGTLLEFLGIKIVTSSVVTSDKAVVFVPNVSVAWKSLTSITSAVIDEPGIGKKVRVWEEGEALLENPKSVVYLSNVGPS